MSSRTGNSLYNRECFLFYIVLAEFLASEEKVQCEESCTQPCEHIEYETSLSYSDLQRGVFIKWLNSFQNTTENFALYENFLNMTYAEQKDYIE